MACNWGLLYIIIIIIIILIIIFIGDLSSIQRFSFTQNNNINNECSAKEQVFHANSGTKAAVLPEGRYLPLQTQEPRLQFY